MLAVDVLVLRVRVVVARREVDRRHAQLRRDVGDVTERTTLRLKALAGDVSLELRVVTVVVHRVVPALPVNLDKQLQLIKALRGLAGLVSGTERFGPDAANLLIAGEQEPRLDPRLLIDGGQRIDTAPVITADALRGHQNVPVPILADMLHRLLVNRVEMGQQHDRRFSTDDDVLVLADDRAVTIHGAQLGEQLLLGGSQVIFQRFHTASASCSSMTAPQFGQVPSSFISISSSQCGQRS